MGHSHVPHGQHRHGSKRRRIGPHTGTRAERGDGLAGAVDRFGNKGVGARFGWRDDDIIRLGHAHLELVGLNRLDIQTVGLDHRHRQAREADIEEGHGGGVDNAQANPLARLEDHIEIIGRRMAIDQVGVGFAGHVCEIARAHSHLPPHAAKSGWVRQGRAVEIQALGILLELVEDPVRMRETPVAEDENIFPVISHWVCTCRIYDDRTVMAELFLQTRMGVIPVSAILRHLELIFERFARFDAREADARHAVHMEGDKQSVPMDRGVFGKPVGDVHCDVIALAQPQERTGKCAIDSGCHTGFAVEPDRELPNFEVEARARK